jgi:peptide deformylase
MATRNILKDGERGLLKKSRVVTDFNKRLHILLDDMRETLIEANGLGLAAPQVGVLRRAALIVDTSIETESLEEQIIELINPEIISTDGEQTGSEGCLSLPGVYGIVMRPEIVKLKAQDRYGNYFELEGKELAARAACHEIDHLDGVIFTSIAERLLTEEELAELTAQREQQDKQAEHEEDI